MQLVHSGITLGVPDGLVAKLVLDHLNGRSAVEPAAPVLSSVLSSVLLPPRIGEYWPAQGGIYAGVGAAEIGGLTSDYHLILGPEHEEDIAWQPAMDWAPTLEVDGHRDFILPLRKEQRILYANLASKFQQRGYWSSEQHAANSDNAWGQTFNGGNQNCWYKYYKLRARAVRRLTI